MSPSSGSRLLPPAMSTFASGSDALFLDLLGFASVVVLALVVAMFVSARRRAREDAPRARNLREGPLPQLAVVVAMVVVLAGFFHRGFAQYAERLAVPDTDVVVRVVARRGDWTFLHANGYEERGEVHLPFGVPVAILMTSEDVLHTFRVPELRVQQDIVPGRTSRTWFEATRATGRTPLGVVDYASARFATGASGTHGDASAPSVHLVAPTSYEALLRDGPPPPPECASEADPESCWGHALYATSGCAGCHSTEPGHDRPAPSWGGTFGTLRTFEDGTSTTMDEAYVLESIRTPQARVVRGYASVQMPAARFSDRQARAVVAYLRSLRR